MSSPSLPLSPKRTRDTLAMSPPFTPVRANSKKNTPSSKIGAWMPPTPGLTPLGPANRFGVLSSHNRDGPRTPISPDVLKPKNLNVNSPTDGNWRSQRKKEKNTPSTLGSNNDLLPTPFHSTQRRAKVQNQNNIPPVTPVRTKKIVFPLTPGDSPFAPLGKPVNLRLAPPLKPAPLFTVALDSPVSPKTVVEAITRENASKVFNPALCAACSRPLTSAALLSPCAHIVCSPCLTGCLNAAGEKPMDCMACKMPISTFQLTNAITSGSALPVSTPSAASVDITQQVNTTPLSTPQVLPINTLGSSIDNEEPCVLRIDNVPWDVTPEMLSDWLGEPTVTICNHALIDRRDGRTLSYAYIEVTQEAMKSILRSRQNTILGSGKRARAVTITVSTQDELMREFFPTWKGHFLGSRPVVAGMDNFQISVALRDGLLSLKDVDDILKLLRRPDSHFVKVPTLPYYHLISVLRKFPSDKDSRVLHTPAVKQALFEFVLVAREELSARVDEKMFTSGLMEKLCKAAVDCSVFSTEQRSHISSLFKKDQPRALPMAAFCLTNEAGVHAEPIEHEMSPASFYDLLATTHNVSPQTVHALANELMQRLALAARPHDENLSVEQPYYSAPL